MPSPFASYFSSSSLPVVWSYTPSMRLVSSGGVPQPDPTMRPTNRRKPTREGRDTRSGACAMEVHESGTAPLCDSQFKRATRSVETRPARHNVNITLYLAAFCYSTRRLGGITIVIRVETKDTGERGHRRVLRVRRRTLSKTGPRRGSGATSLLAASTPVRTPSRCRRSVCLQPGGPY